jgi:two-component system alkaline phosphatase synthesis response regulator PhoP
MARREASSTRGKKRSSRLRAGGLTLDTTERNIIKNGVATHLTFKECALLEMLMSNRGEVVSRKELMREVWETDYLGDTRTLDVHICWVRSKIEDDPREPALIRTVRGVGYWFDVPSKKRKRSR